MLSQLRTIIGSTMSTNERRVLQVLAVLSLVMLAGVTVTGVWQFFTFEPDPLWFAYTPGTDFDAPSAGPEGGTAMHAFFADGCAALALFGGAWVVFKVLFTIPKSLVAGFLATLFGIFGGGLIRFRVVKIDGLTHEEAADGYAQLFTNEVDYVVTDSMELSAWAIRLMTVGHVLTVPLILLVAWVALSKSIDAHERAAAETPTRYWATDHVPREEA